jgi:hypothetical protein
MRHVRELVTVIMLVLWIPATQHCELEWAGLLSECAGCNDRADGAGQDTDADGCATVEKSAVQPTGATMAKLPIPDFSAQVCMRFVPRLRPRICGLSQATEAPGERVHSWLFVERAVPPSRAPTHTS